MNVFIAGGSGTIGIPLVRALAASGHQVTALTRSTSRHDELRVAGAVVAVADALNREALASVVEAARPTHVVHQLTALPKDGPRSSRDLEATNRLRVEGTRNLLDAAIHAGARRFVVGSFAVLAPRAPVGAEPPDAAAAAIHSMESQVLDATARGAIEGVILRYGMFYGLQTPSTVAMLDMVRKRRLPVVRHDAGRLPLIHLEDAVSATTRALAAAPAGAVYDIVDDEPVSFTRIVEALAEYTGSAVPFRVPGWLLRLVAPQMARMIAMRLDLSNTAAKADLGWRPVYPTLRQGLAPLRRGAA